MKLFLKDLLFTICVPGTAGVYLPWLIAHRPSGISLRALSVLGIMLLAAGFSIYIWTVWDFAVAGRGTPLPIDAPRKLVVRGLYHYVRNPMYLGVILVILGWASLYANVWLLVYALGVGTAVHLFVIFYEEPRLRHLFGTEYEAYCQAVMRWVPRIPKSGG